MDISFPYAVQWLPFEERETLDRTVRIMQDLRIPELRTAFSWADWEREGGPAWFDHFIGKVSQAGIRLMPCLFYTPAHRAQHRRNQEPRSSFPPKRLEDYADFTREMIGRYGHAFEWIHFWNESNWDVYWNWEMDPGWRLFAAMVAYAIPVAKDAGKKIVLGGLSPYEPTWVNAMAEFGVLRHANALGIHAFPGTWDANNDRRKGRPWRGLEAEVEDARKQLRTLGSQAEIWLTETGYSTFGEGEFLEERLQKQIDYWNELRKCPAERAYWHTLIDQKGGTPTDNELNSDRPLDEKAYHFGVVDEKGKPKPLYAYWEKATA